MARSPVTAFTPRSAESRLWRLLSVRAVSLVFFVLALVLTTLLVVLVMVRYSSGALRDLKDSSSRTMLSISNRSATIMATTAEQAGSALTRTVELSSSSMMAASSASQAQVQTLTADMLSKVLAQAFSTLPSGITQTLTLLGPRTGSFVVFVVAKGYEPNSVEGI